VNVRKNGPVAALVVAAAIGLAACGGSSSSPHVTSQGSQGQSTGSESSPAAVSPVANVPSDVTQLLNKWTACMRSNGDPNQTVPTVVTGDAIVIHEPAGYNGTIYGPTGNNPSGAGVTCESDLSAASIALRNGQPWRQYTGSQMANYTVCMRANGVPGYSDPGDKSGHPGPAISSPAMLKANQLCYRKTGVEFETLNGSVIVPGEIVLGSGTGFQGVQEIFTGPPPQ
jgi:hypothetical protein